ncbi:SAM-dependent methyltransferase [Sutcliffiella horikoshii]|uniref:SAM-dependent methyltransferase n=1 Tax=Sutcliffiella horikoshii TaxID=79883 RepID=A0ABM6KL19_9BACI|nr:class I SAM-dependent methyltransferase [Sutcliffiella horikoshii]ART77143.1 SAM-dependent methyltransferase [Sutcliffiella horikoshii]
MEFRGSRVYDQSDFFTNYMNRRNRKDSPNNAIEGPIMSELVGNIQNKTILDLGCGDASFGKELLHLGAKHYTGVEGSEQMVKAARSNLLELDATIHNETMGSFNYPSASYDLVTSRFAIHYVSDIDRLFRNIYQSLKEDGRFVFSIQHPLTTSSFASKESGDKRGNWIVDDYFLDGERKEPWINQVVVKYHRTIEQYFTALREAGFTIQDLREGTPVRKHFRSEEEFLRRQRIPVVLAFGCGK